MRFKLKTCVAIVLFAVLFVAGLLFIAASWPAEEYVVSVDYYSVVRWEVCLVNLLLSVKVVRQTIMAVYVTLWS